MEMVHEQALHAVADGDDAPDSTGCHSSRQCVHRAVTTLLASQPPEPEACFFHHHQGELPEAPTRRSQSKKAKREEYHD